MSVFFKLKITTIFFSKTFREKIFHGKIKQNKIMSVFLTKNYKNFF